MNEQERNNFEILELHFEPNQSNTIALCKYCLENRKKTPNLKQPEWRPRKLILRNKLSLILSKRFSLILEL